MKEAIILAGGLGTRLQSVVNDKPKCMAEVAGEPFLKYLFDYLEKERFTHIILALGYKSEYVIEWLSSQQNSFDISYVIEREPLGTGGAIKLAVSKSKGSEVFVLNGDTYFGVNTEDLLSFHHNHHSKITLALKPMFDFNRYGSVEVDSEKRVVCFNEKKHQTEGLINGGVYLLNKKIFNNIESQKFSFEKDVLESQLDTIGIYGNVQDSYFIDIGIPEDYKKANSDFLNFK